MSGVNNVLPAGSLPCFTLYTLAIYNDIMGLVAIYTVLYLAVPMDCCIQVNSATFPSRGIGILILSTSFKTHEVNPLYLT